MSADEIKGLAETLKVWREECGVHPVHIWDAHVDMENALLAYAAMVERCEKLIKPCNLEDAPCVPSDDGYCDSCDVPKHNDLINYILKGATDGR